MNTERWASRGLPLVLIGMIGVVVWLNAERQGQPPVVVACPGLSHGCSVELAGREVSLGSDGAIRTLKPFGLWVRAANANKVEARFTMEGMDMGFNLYALHPDQAGIFRATVTLPVCVTGRRDWHLTVDVDGHRLTVPFVTDL